MPAPLSLDLRTRVVAAYERGEGSQQKIADRFGIGVASVKRWVRRKRESGSLVAGRRPPPDPKLDADALAILVEVIETSPDLTRSELAAELAERGLPLVSVATIGRALRRAGYSRKKNNPRRRA